MLKKIITMLLIGLFTIVPVLGGTGVVKAEDNSIKVDVKYVTGEHVGWGDNAYQRVVGGHSKVYILADGERIGELPLKWNWSTKSYQGEYQDVDVNKEYTIEAENNADLSYWYQYRQFNKWYYSSYDIDVQGSAEEGFTVINTLMTNIHGKVTFVDDKYPSEIKINLLKNDEVIDTIVTDASKNWEYDFGKHCAVNDDETATIYNVAPEEVDGHYARTLGYDIEIVPCSTVTLTKELKGESKEKEFGVYILPNFESQHMLWLQKLNRRYPLSTALLGIRWADEFIKNAKKYDKISNSEPLYPVVSAVFDEEFVNSVMSKVISGEVKNDADLTPEEFEKGFNLCKKCRDWFILEGEHKYDTTVQAANVDPDVLDREVMEKSNLLLSTSWLLFRYAPDKAGDSWGSDYLGEDGQVNNDELREILAVYPFESFQDYIDKVVRNNMYFYTTIKAGETKTIDFPVENFYSLLIVENDYEDTQEPEAIKIVKLDRVVYDGEDYSDISFNNYEATLTNIGTPSPVDVILTGKKTLTGRDIKDDEFTFEVKEGDKIIGETTNKGEDIVFPAINYTQDDIGTHTYTISEKKETLGGVEYDTHTETVTVEVSDNGDGTLKTDIKTDDDGITFSNKYSANGSAKITGKKNLEGKDMDTFSFILKEGDKVIDETTNNTKGEFSFKDIPYASAGTHTYTIIEKNDNKPGVAYDTHTETVTVDVTDNGDGTLNTDIKTDNDGVTFNNKYSTSGKVVISGKKVLDGKSMDNFTFVLKEGNEVIDEAVNDANGNFSFKELNYTSAGTHTYTITEKNDSKGGIEYDTHTETVVINTTDNGDGTLKVDVKTDNDGVIFNNKYSSSGQVNFIGQKKFNKEMKDFSFELKENGKTIQTVKNDNDGKITFDTISYSLEDVGEHTYTIQEVNDSKPGIAYDTHIEIVKVNVADNGDGTLTATPVYDTDGIVFENTYSATGKISISGKKIFNNKAMDSSASEALPQFSFVLKEGETEIATVKNSDTGEFTFPEIEYNEAGKHTYTIEEINDNKPGVTYDEHVETITVEVIDNGDGTLGTETVFDEDGVVFTNTYNADGTFTISGTKKLEGRKLTDGEFAFVLTDHDGNVKETTVKADGTFEFEPFSFTINDIGKTFTYKVTEKNNGIENVTYDEHTEEIAISVEDNGDGTLKITPVYDEDGVVFVNKYTEPVIETPTEEPTETSVDTPTFTPDGGSQEATPQTPETTTVADTGDKSVIPLIIAGILSAAGIVATGIILKKRKNN